MNRKLIPTLLVAMSLLFTACASPSATTAKDVTTTAKAQTTTTTPTTTTTTTPTPTITTITSTIEANGTLTAKEFNDFKTQKESEITALKEEIDGLKKETGITPDNSALAFSQRPAGMLYFPVITLNPDDQTPYNAGYVAIEPQLSVSEKLVKLTAAISKILFNGSKLEVTDIKDENGQQIAYINLVNATDWEEKFQGSTGGGINSQSLVLSYLQKDFKNSWIDGVHFTLDGKNILLDHAPILEETQLRAQ